jgi:hypothetical protein
MWVTLNCEHRDVDKDHPYGYGSEPPKNICNFQWRGHLILVQKSDLSVRSWQLQARLTDVQYGTITCIHSNRNGLFSFRERIP